MSAPFDAQAMDERQEYDGKYGDERDYDDAEVLQAWELMVREGSYREDDEPLIYCAPL